MPPTLDDSPLYKSRFSPVCSICEHYKIDPKVLKTCAAFPKNNIPDEIWTGKNKHTQPYPGDHGIQFKKKKLKR